MKEKLLLVTLSMVLFIGGCTQQTDVSKSLVSNVEWSFTQAGQHPEQQLIQVIGSAQKTLDIAIYSLTYPGIVDAIKKAKQRGVDVRLITDSIQSGGKTQKEALKLLGSAEIPMKINAHSGLMHLKMTIVDGKTATTGSFNYSKSASTTNDEMLVVFHDEKVAQSFQVEFERMWKDTQGFQTLEATIARADPAPAPAPETEAQSADKSLAPCANPQIKGNVNAKGGKIFHIPGGRYYDDTKAEEMFCTEQEAEGAGYRKSGR